MKEVYIIAPYPYLKNIKDGMIQRIKVIDDLLSNHKRVYINLALNNPAYKKIVHDDNLTEFLLNPLMPFTVIRILLKAKIIYIHSIHPFKFLFYSFLFITKSTNLILDAHGVVPEEINLYGKNLKYRYMLWIERKVFEKLSHCICVSNAMIEHFKQRFSNLSIQYHLLFTSELLPVPTTAEVDTLRNELNINTEDIVIIYSGNTQLWQNISKMMDSIEGMINSNIKVIILTGNMAEFENIIAQKKLDLTNIILKSVLPSELGKYYQLAHYGYILRDDILVNRVANPTKMLEYLQFGVQPIVLSAAIGDYLQLGYEYVNVSDINSAKLVAQKSKINQEIADRIIIGKNNFNMEALISN